jgi:hypothetical protein
MGSVSAILVILITILGMVAMGFFGDVWHERGWDG